MQECVSGDVFGSTRCECARLLRAAMAAITAERRGLLLYLRGTVRRGAAWCRVVPRGAALCGVMRCGGGSAGQCRGGRQEATRGWGRVMGSSARFDWLRGVGEDYRFDWLRG